MKPTSKYPFLIASKKLRPAAGRSRPSPYRPRCWSSLSRLYSATTSRYAAHLRQPLNPRQQALVQQTQARQLYLASRAVVRPDVRSEAQRRADHAAGVLSRSEELVCIKHFL